MLAEIEQRSQDEEELFRGCKLESLGVLASGIAHDFNNFLTIISANIALAKMQLNPAESVCDVLQQAAAACKRATSLASQLLTFGKGGVLVRRPTPIAGVVKDAVDLARAGAHVTIDPAIADDLWCAEIDIEQISHALHNILLNARQAMPEAIELYQKAKDSGHRFHAVLVDLTIPGGMGGTEVAARLREIDDSNAKDLQVVERVTTPMDSLESFAFGRTWRCATWQSHKPSARNLIVSSYDGWLTPIYDSADLSSRSK